MNRFSKSFRKKLLFLNIIVLLIIFAIIHAAVYMEARDAIVQQIKKTTQGIATAIAEDIIENSAEYEAFLKNRDVQSEYYRRMREKFAQIKSHSNVKFIYTERRIDAKTIEFILDAEPFDSIDYSPPSAVYPNDIWREAAYSTKQPSAFSIVYFARWGNLLGAYAPIIVQKGGKDELLGLVGVNIDSSLVSQRLNRLQIILLLIYIVFILSVSVALMTYFNTILEHVFKDKLTGAYTKRYCETLIQNEILAAKKSDNELALMMLDLDHFKNINDTYGHNFGDLVLMSVSKTIQHSLRQNDYFIRYGGEEFIAVIANVSEKHVLEIAGRIRSAVEKETILYEEKNIPVKVTISIGIAKLRPEVNTVQDFIANADKALYDAKITRNCIRVFDSE